MHLAGCLIDAHESWSDRLAIAPWNSPILLTVRAILVPILCGNTVVLKCSEFSPRSQAIVAELFHEVTALIQR